MKPSTEQMLGLYKMMVRSRAFEEMVAEQVQKGHVPCSWMSGIGQEGTMAALCQLRSDDHMTYTHRGAYSFISRGSEPSRLLAELFGKSTGYCKGKGGRHIADLEHGVMGKSGAIGSHAPIAVGMATAIQIRGGDQVVISLFGDGTSNRGTTHSALNTSALWKLPIVWICENNGYAGAIPSADFTTFKAASDMAAAYGIPGISIDGNDPLTVYAVAGEAITRARKGAGPTLIELKTYRVGAFAIGAKDLRDPEEIMAWKQRDPIERLRRQLLEMDLLSEQLIASIDQEARIEMDSAVRFAEESPFPNPEDAYQDLYA
ncbi:MAG: thiamine pyrophosphate-dependent dehydrogenase E1 component subunit alpha [Gammaproteobacteria bacterium]|nr:thiamine pyrophosphate-dependent dehydrogenase E1 component subunit alpha [Gammaproteobacteria bacterium]